MASAIYDPLSRIDLPAPRHDVQSDDETDSEDEQGAAGQSHTDAGQVVFSAQHLHAKPTLVLVDQVGEGIAQHLRIPEQASVHWEDIKRGHSRQIASLGQFPNGTTVVLLSPGSYLRADLSRLSAVIREIIVQLRPTNIQLLTQYHPALYISTEAPSDDPPLRHLATTRTAPLKHAAPYAPPNYLSSTLDACVLQEAAFLGIPAFAVLLPLTRPQSQSVAYVRAPKKRTTKTPKTALDEEFPSDDDGDDVADDQDQPDPTVSSVLGDDYDVAGALQRVDDVWKEAGQHSTVGSAPLSLPAAVTSTPTVAAFIATRRQHALKTRSNVGGMYM